MLSAHNVCDMHCYMQYFEIGCGGKNRNRKPSELVSNGLINAQYDEQFRKYGVVETFTKVLAVSVCGLPRIEALC